jgi:phospholipid/cholesterol/gamma-HCH transport system ATP-binding protein
MIEFTGIQKSFGAKEVLRGVDLTIRPGENTFIIGTSGTGKSVLMKHAVGLLQPDAGSCSVDGETVNALDLPAIDRIRLKCQYVFQGSALLDSMTLAENVALPLEKHRGMVWADALDRARELLGIVGAGSSAGRYPAEIGGGVRKLAAIARSLAMEPKYLILDEPTTSLDPVSARRVDRLIGKLLVEQNVSSIVVSHDLKSIYGVADVIVFLHKGLVRAYARREELRTHPDTLLQAFLHGHALQES